MTSNATTVTYMMSYRNKPIRMDCMTCSTRSENMAMVTNTIASWESVED